MNKKTIVFAFYFLATSAESVVAQESAVMKFEPLPPLLEVRALAPLRTTLINDSVFVFYELCVSNFSIGPLTIKEVEVRNAADSTVLATFGPGIFDKRVSPVKSTPGTRSTSLGVSEFFILYIELRLARNSNVNSLLHRVTLFADDTPGKIFKINYAVSIAPEAPVVLASPLRMGPWAAIYDPSWERGHRRVTYGGGGNINIPGRFAMDFVKLDERGKYTGGDENQIAGWYGYNAEVFAVADGVVSSMRDDFKESPTISGHADYPAALATGNYISLKIGTNRFAFYEHLKPNSILVKPGQKVKKGEKIAAVGFTGQSMGPHLHFHVADRDSPLAAEGMPFVFDNFEIIGVLPDFSEFGTKMWAEVNHDRRAANELPPPNHVVMFR